VNEWIENGDSSVSYHPNIKKGKKSEVGIGSNCKGISQIRN
jgi:hypothetical protein